MCLICLFNSGVSHIFFEVQFYSLSKLYLKLFAIISSSKRMSYKRNPFTATKKRKQKQKRQERTFDHERSWFDPELKSELKTLDRGSWFEQNILLEAFPIPEKDINQTNGGSASHKRYWTQEISMSMKRKVMRICTLLTTKLFMSNLNMNIIGLYHSANCKNIYKRWQYVKYVIHS